MIEAEIRMEEIQEKANAIPKLIHWIWFDSDLPDTEKRPYRARLQKWRKLNPDYEMHLWYSSKMMTTAERKSLVEFAMEHKVTIHDISNPKEKGIPCFNRDLINKLIDKMLADNKPANAALLSDYLRYAIMYEYGGVYADCDVEPKKPLGDLCPEYGFYIDISPSGIELENHLHAAHPFHPVYAAINFTARITKDIAEQCDAFDGCLNLDARLRQQHTMAISGDCIVPVLAGIKDLPIKKDNEGWPIDLNSKKLAMLQFPKDLVDSSAHDLSWLTDTKGKPLPELRNVVVDGTKKFVLTGRRAQNFTTFALLCKQTLGQAFGKNPPFVSCQQLCEIGSTGTVGEKNNITKFLQRFMSDSTKLYYKNGMIHVYVSWPQNQNGLLEKFSDEILLRAIRQCFSQTKSIGDVNKNILTSTRSDTQSKVFVIRGTASDGETTDVKKQHFKRLVITTLMMCISLNLI